MNEYACNRPRRERDVSRWQYELNVVNRISHLFGSPKLEKLCNLN